MSEPIRVSIEYPNGGIDNAALVTRVGEGRYRLELDPIPEMIAETEEEIQELPRFGDTIEADTLKPDLLKYIAVAERSKLRRFDWLVPAKVADSGSLQTIFAKVDAEGGHWEQVLRGIVIICLPVGSSYDPSEEMERLIRDA